ncbi:MAG: 23S rRNA (guanosine(2251)-2'-O)-methyltransferase RlmB [Thermodesulfobacteriota bacterium]
MGKTRKGSSRIWGIHPVLEMLKAKPELIQNISIQESRSGEKLAKIIRLARQNQVMISFVKTIRVPNVSGENHQGVIAEITEYPVLEEDQFLVRLDSIKKPFLLALDSLQDPHNLGAILRSAAAAGVDGIILTRDRSAPLTGTVAKISAGALACLTICRSVNLSRFLQELKKKDIWIYGTSGQKGNSLYRTEIRDRICVVIGGEEKGIRPLVQRQCDFDLAIPMAGELDSLNASTAAAVILFEIRRQRLQQS